MEEGDEYITRYWFNQISVNENAGVYVLCFY